MCPYGHVVLFTVEGTAMNIEWQGAQDLKDVYGCLIENELNVSVEARDQASAVITHAQMRSFAQLGIYTYSLPETWGGFGWGYAPWGKVLEKIGYLSRDVSFPFLISVRMSFINALLAVQRADINDIYMRDLIEGKKAGAFAYTENADAFSFLSCALPEKETEYYLLNGLKAIVTGAETADIFLMFVRGETADIQVFLVRADDPGVAVTPRAMHGCRSTGIASVEMVNVRVHKSRLLIATDGLSFAQRYFLNCRRALQTTLFLGRARAVIEATLGYLHTTVRHQRPLIDLQHVQALVGEMYILLESARTSVFYALHRQDRAESDPYWDSVSSSAKYQAVEAVNKIAALALNVTGGWGYSESSGIGRAQRDFASLIAGADPQEKLKVDIGIQKIHEIEMYYQRYPQ